MNRKNRITNETWEALAKRYPKTDVSPIFDVSLTVKQSQLIRLALGLAIARGEDQYEFLDTPSERMKYALLLQEYKEIADILRDTMHQAMKAKKNNE